MKQRIEIIDTLKGILMLLVFLGHSIQFSYEEHADFAYDKIFECIYSFHMPLFMAISGYLFYFSQKHSVSYILKSKIEQIFIPATFFSAFYWLRYDRTISLLNLNIFSAERSYWFLWSIIFCVAFFVLIRVCGNRLTHIVVANLLLLLLPDEYIAVGDKFMLWCFSIGFIANKYDIVKKCNKKMYVFIAFTIYFLLMLFWSKNAYIYFYGFCIFDGALIDILQNDIYRIVTAISGSVFFVYIISLCTFHKYLISSFKHISKYSIGYYGFQTLLFQPVRHIVFLIDMPLVCRVPFFFVVIFFISWVCIVIANKFTITKKIILGGR